MIGGAGLSTHQQTTMVRRVVTGVNPEGRSVIVRDGEAPTSVRRPTGTVVTEVWRTDSLPARNDEEPKEGGDILAPPPAGVCFRIAVFPPDNDIDADARAAYEKAMQDIYGDQGDEPRTAIAGMHQTETIDVTTVLDGEIWLVMEEGETLLRRGDCLVQRGTRHAWSNRSDRPCTLASTMLGGIQA
jgi:hypothetical protein